MVSSNDTAPKPETPVNAVADQVALAGALEHFLDAAAHAVALRHELHEHPELGYQEKYTAGVICRELTRLGVEFKTGYAGGTGVVGLIRGELPAEAGGMGGVTRTDASPPPEKCVALRADMDALPVDELTRLPYASQTKGYMHACGHDGHMAVLLGTAAVLKQAAGKFRGTVKLLFQPAEEGGCGASRMVQDGVLENPRVDAIFGLHGWPGLKVGMVSTKPGPLLASVDGVTIRITGRGSHAAAPQMGIDPVLCGAALVQALQQIVARETEPGEAAVVTIAQFHAGAGFNVIPETAELNGTIRALTPERRAAMIRAIERITLGVAAAHGCTAAVTYDGATPSTTNTPALADFVKQVAQQVLGEDRFVPTLKLAMWGEDFAFYLQAVPGCFFVLGVQPEERISHPMLHNPYFDFTDAAIPVGIRMFSALALDFLGGRAE